MGLACYLPLFLQKNVDAAEKIKECVGMKNAKTYHSLVLEGILEKKRYEIGDTPCIFLQTVSIVGMQPVGKINMFLVYFSAKNNFRYQI